MEILEECHIIHDIPSDFKYEISPSQIKYTYQATTTLFEYKCSSDTINFKPITFPLAHHILRIMDKKLGTDHNINYIFDTIDTIIKLILNPTIYCTICAKSISSSKIDCCSNPICFDTYSFGTPLDETILTHWKRDSLMLIFLCRTAVECLRSTKREKVFTPFPKRFIKKDLKQFDTIISLLENWQDKLIKTSQKATNEYEIYLALGPDVYYFFKFVILTNRTYIRSENITDKVFNDTELDSLLIQSKSDSKFMNFQVLHNPIIEEKFKLVPGAKPEYLFHGSPISNWYSIMRNGLKNYSGTDMMANGQAHGPGIYMTDSVQFSLSYSYEKTKLSENKLFVIGVVQVLDRESFKKTTSIYVINDDTKILIRYLILTDGTHLPDIQKYIMSDRVAEIKSFNDNINSIIIKRLSKELKLLESLPKVTVSTAPARWTINLDSTYTIEIKFFDSYPTDPPFVRVVQPLILDSPMVDHSGLIRLPELTLKNWNTKITISSLITKIYALLQISKHKPGSYDETKAFENYCQNQFL